MQLARYMTLLLSSWAESAKYPSPSLSDAGPPPAPSRQRRASPLPLLLLLPLWLRLAKPLGVGSHAETPVTRSSPGKLSCSAYIIFFLLMHRNCFLMRVLLFFSVAPLLANQAASSIASPLRPAPAPTDSTVQKPARVKAPTVEAHASQC